MRETEPHVFKVSGDAWGELETKLLELPERVGDKDVTQLPGTLAPSSRSARAATAC